MSNPFIEGLSYGSGRVFATDADGVTHEVAQLTGVDLEFSGEYDEYSGRYDVTLASVMKRKKLTGKASGIFDNALMAKCFGAVKTAGRTLHYTEVFAYTTGTVTVANAATYVDTLEVRDAAGKAMVKVTSAPAIGQYSVAAGVYTFNVAEPDGNITVEYQATSATGSTFTVSAATRKLAPTVKLVLSKPDLESNPASITLYAVRIDKMSLSGKAEGFSEGGFDFTAQADATGKFFTKTE